MCISYQVSESVRLPSRRIRLGRVEPEPAEISNHALNQFISRSSNQLRPLFLALRVSQRGWNVECDRALQGIKAYFSSSVVLCQPVPGEELFLYLVASNVVIIKSGENGEQKPVYFTSKMLIESEARYDGFENIKI